MRSRVLIVFLVTIVSLASGSQNPTVGDALTPHEVEGGTKVTAPQVLTDLQTTGRAAVIVLMAADAAIDKSQLRHSDARALVRRTVLAARKQLLRDPRVASLLASGSITLDRVYRHAAAFAATIDVTGLHTLESHAGVASIEPNPICFSHDLEAAALMNVGPAYLAGYDGSGISIAIVDTGIDYTHSEFGGSGFPNQKVTGGTDFGDNDSDPMDCQGHGTACAGIAAGSTLGVAHAARLIGLKIVTGCDAYAPLANIYAAWDWCIEHQNDDLSNPILLVSTSFGDSSSFASNCDTTYPSGAAIAESCRQAGLSLFVSSGNNGRCSGIAAPACLSSVRSVGAVFDTDIGPVGFCLPDGGSCVASPDVACSPAPPANYRCDDSSTAVDQVPCYSNSSFILDLFAPSHCATTAALGGGTLSCFGGTSAACPYAAGAAALLQQDRMVVYGSYCAPDALLDVIATNGDSVQDAKAAPPVAKPRINIGQSLLRDASSTATCSWSPLATGGALTGIVGALAVFDDGNGPALYVGYSGGVFRWDGSTWLGIGGSPCTDTEALAVFDDGGGSALYAGIACDGGSSQPRVFRWDGSSWTALPYPGFGNVYSLTSFDDGTGASLFVGAAGGILKWNGTTWSSIGNPNDITVAHALTTFDDGSGPALFAGGDFTAIGGAPLAYIAKWDGSNWSPLGTGMNYLVRALAVFDDGTGDALFAGGYFTSAGGVAARSIAKWDGSLWAPLGSGIDGSVNDLAVFDDGEGPALYAGGEFSALGCVSPNRVAGWRGSGWFDVGKGVGPDGGAWIRSVRALSVFDDGTGPGLYAGGTFDTAGGVAAARIAQWKCFLSPAKPPVPHGMTKNRYTSFAPNNGANRVGFRLVRTTAPGDQCWVAAPLEIKEGQYVAGCSDTPVFRVWQELVVHVGDCPIIPDASYEIRATMDGMAFSAPLALTTVPRPEPKFWGDTVGAFDVPNQEWTGPNGVVNTNDIVAALKGFQGEPSAPHFTVVDVVGAGLPGLEPCLNRSANIADVFNLIKAFQGSVYPFTTDPAACPPCP